MDVKIADQIEATWAECGRKVRPLRNMVFVRTELIPEYIGRVFIPASLRGNYSDLPHKVFMNARVIGVGPRCNTVKLGDRVAFSRLFFARWQEMADKTLVGWILEDNVYCSVDEEIEVKEKGSSEIQAPLP